MGSRVLTETKEVHIGAIRFCDACRKDFDIGPLPDGYLRLSRLIYGPLGDRKYYQELDFHNTPCLLEYLLRGMREIERVTLVAAEDSAEHSA